MEHIITVSRQFGSGGRIIAERVANKLGIPLYDKEILEKAAADSGIAKEHFEKADERRTNSFLFSLVSAHYGTSTPMEINNIINDDNLFLHTAETIKNIASEPCVIVGRCADDILKDYKLLRVFVCAELPDRIKRISERFEIAEKAAGTLIKKTDKNRANFYNFYSGKTWGDAANYDICINTSKITYDEAADIIVSFFAKNK